MIKNTYFTWDEEECIMQCSIIDEKGNESIGIAICHEDDRDMMSQKTGQEIAYFRAKIEYLRNIRDNDLLPRLAALKQLYYSMKHSTHFNPNSYENKMLQRQIRLIEFDLATTKEIKAMEQKQLKAFIEDKEKLYQSVRKHRTVSEEGQN